MKKEEFLKKAKEIHGDKYNYSLITEKFWKENYKNKYKTKVPIKCKEHGVFYQSIYNHLLGKNCPICSNSAKLTKNEFIKRAKKAHGDKYNYSLITEDWWRENYKGSKKTKIPIICKKHGVFYQIVFNHLIGSGCQKCAGNQKLKLNHFLERAKKVHEDRYNYSLITEDWWKENYKNTYTLIPIICKKHGVFYQRVNDHLQNHGCPKCQISKGEALVEKFLKENNINYIYQKQIKIKNRKKPFYFDFYLPDYNLAIEFDGIFHFENPDERLKNRVLNQKERDQLKNQYCKENGINLLRIPYWRYQEINKILKIKMKELKHEK